MKKQFNHLKLFLPALFILTCMSGNAQVNQEYTFELTTTRTNTMASRALIDVPELTDKPFAIILATPVGDTKKLNTHPTGAWYYQGKWNLFNTDHASLPLGLTYKLTYFLKPDVNQFLYVVTKQNLGDNGSYINHPALDNNPNAQFAFFQNHAPGVRTNGLNGFEEEAVYNTVAGKWYIRNIGGRELLKGATYNIVVYSPGPTLVTTPFVTTPLVKTVPPVTTNDKTVGETWSLNGNNLNNTNTGNVGIGNNNPAYRLDVSGPMLVRSSGATTGSAGIWLNNDYNYKAALIGMENDNHVGFFGFGINGWKFSMNTNTGALKINGSEGKPGQVLVSNAPAAPNYTSIGNVIRTEIKKGSVGVEAKVSGTYYHLPQLTHTITLTSKSRIIISAQMIVSAHCPFYLCDASSFHLLLKVGNSIVFDQQYDATMVSIQPSICNYIIELDPGTHSLDFYDHFIGGNTHWITPMYSSIIILPVD